MSASAGGRTVLFVCSTPLHSLWALAIASGPLASARCVLWSMSANDDERNLIAEALEEAAPGHASPFVQIRRFGVVSRKRLPDKQQRRQAMEALTAEAERVAPDLIFVANDGTRQFQCIARGAPRAEVAYLDDGVGSYLTLPRRSLGDSLREVWRGFKRWRRYGHGYVTPLQMGLGARVKQAWVAYPALVHPALARKPLRPIEADWVRAPSVQRICHLAVQRAGLDPRALASIDTLMLLPHEDQIAHTAGLRELLEQRIHAATAQGRKVAIKRHPRSAGLGVSIDAGALVEIPRRLPVEVLAPLLSGVRVVGAMTSALIYLPWLGADVQVESIRLPGLDRSHPILALYERLGIPAI